MAQSTTVLEYLEFTQLSNPGNLILLSMQVLEYLEFTQLSNPEIKSIDTWISFRVPGIYTALKPVRIF